jgi:glycine dehydrogenase
LLDALIPAAIRSPAPQAIAPSRSEAAALAEIRSIASRNAVYQSFIGQGYYGCHTPSVILRNVLENPGWYTAYTPYQPEISQGRLEALINFQTLVADLTGMAIANASMLDEATAAAEAMALCVRMRRNDSRVFFVSADCLPQTIEVVRTRAQALGITVVVGPAPDLAHTDGFGVLLQYPGVDGEVSDDRALVRRCHDAGKLVVVAADLLALTILEAPGLWGADVVVGSAQRFGVPLGYGGPHAGYLATRDEFKRSMPGRLVGVSVDANGAPAYRLALQTREQHIRREKATSNICTAQVLLAVMAALYAVYHGPQGLRAIAERVHRLTGILRAGLEQAGLRIRNVAHFDTLTVETGSRTDQVHAQAAVQRMNLRQVDPTHVGLSLDELSTRDDVERLWAVLLPSAMEVPDFAAVDRGVGFGFPATLQRTSPYLTHPVFQRYHSETEMLRYLRRLADRDIALDRAMIPLGSCTMKLNAAAEMLPITWPEFGAIHPFAPAAQVQGYAQLIGELERALCALTGYSAISFQPNAGSQGEYAGLLIIRAYHASRGQGQRDVCLIPSSAHGTNPASAQMAGMQVVVVDCDLHGNVDLTDLRAKAQAHQDRLAAVMITYPSTHGVFESAVVEVCDVVHGHGGQVYIDGANLNAMLGLCAPGRFGGDVSHLNLHKTFCIPHGGGGPGVGPVAVAAHLVPFLPGHATGGLRATAHAIGAVSAAPFGSAGILPIPWMYIAMMGGEGLRRASEAAILAANYIACKLQPHYPVLYSGPQGVVAHECILDLRPLKASAGISAEDVAKRLIDYGFHAPTMSFPVPGTLMVEPTESESKVELDRFVDAMIAIRAEIREIEEGALDREDNPLRNAPHTAATLVGDWSHRYSRERAVYPVAALRERKYWPPVGRVDNVYGDRNLFCSCIPTSAYAETL